MLFSSACQLDVTYEQLAAYKDGISNLLSKSGEATAYYFVLLEFAPNNLAARCVNGRGLVTFKVS